MLSLWSFRVIKTCCLAICSVRLSMLSSWAMNFACKSMMLVASLLAFLLVVVMLSPCREGRLQTCLGRCSAEDTF